MEKSLFLPFDASPALESDYRAAYLYAIVSGNIGEHYLPWISEKYINCSFNPETEDQKFSISVWDNPSSRKGLMQYQLIDLKKEVFSDFHPDPVAFFKTVLSLGVYINFKFRWKYLPSHIQNATGEQLQEGVVIGYDDCKQSFVVKRSDPACRLLTYELAYRNLEGALYDTTGPQIKLHFWFYRPETVPKTDLSAVVRYLQDYIHSRHSRVRNPVGLPYGFCAIEALINDCRQCMERGELPNTQYLRSFAEHKYFMYLRMQYSASQQIVPEKAAFSAQKVHLLANCTRNQPELGTLPEVFAAMTETLAIEREYLPAAVESIQAFQQSNAPR